MKSKKFTVEFGPKATERLERLAQEEETTQAEIVRRALQEYDETRSRRTVGIRSEEAVHA